jgi:acyl-CoA synthetase (AMP-forming)/AMP-acid ligase II
MSGEKDLKLLWHYLKKHASEVPDKPFMVSEKAKISYAEALEKTRALAKGFLEAGVRHGDRIAMLTPAREEFMYAYMAAGMVGAMWLGVSTRYMPDEIRYVVSDSRPSVLITVDTHLGRDYRPVFQELLHEYDFIKKCLVIGESTYAGMENFESFLSKSRPNLDAALNQRQAQVEEDDGALIVYTSGTTGQPKGAVLTHKNIIRNIIVQDERFLIEKDDKWLLHFPVNHVAGATEVAIGGLIPGITLVLMDHFDPRDVLETIVREKVTVVHQIPTMYILQMNVPNFSDYDLSCVRKFLWAGSTAPREMVLKLREIPGATLITGYGLTEVVGFVTYTKPEDDIETLITTVGAIDPEFELKLFDKQRNGVPLGEVGEVAIRGDTVMKGYWEKPEATRETINEEGWFFTGDLARMDERGYITLVGRAKEMYISGGFNVYPREIEDVIEKHPAVMLVCVLAKKDPVFQEVGRAVVVVKGGSSLTEQELRDYCKERLANYKVPKEVIFRPQLPMLGVGKIDKQALKRELSD